MNTNFPMPPMARRGLMLVLSAPSGAGKTAVAHKLLEVEPEIHLSVSATTRPLRPDEINGVHYHFTTPDRFAAMVNDGTFLEYAEVFGHYYGTPHQPVEDALAAGRDVLFDIDWQGARQIAQKAHSDLVSVFILPPSTQALEERLRARAQDNDDVIRKRMDKAASEISHWKEYDYVLINDDLDKATRQVRAILIAERMRQIRQTGLPAFAERLQQQR